MPLSYSAGLVDRFREIVRQYDVVEEIDKIIDHLRKKGATDEEIDGYFYRKYGFPPDFRSRYKELAGPAPTPGE